MDNEVIATEVARRSRESFAVFICSSDSRRDVIDQTLPAMLKFWPHCPWPIYIGLNTHTPTLNFAEAVLAPQSQWDREFATQLEQLDHPYLLLILDDFLIEDRVDQRRRLDLGQEVVRLKLDYLRLVPLGRSLRRECPEDLYPSYLLASSVFPLTIRSIALCRLQSGANRICSSF